MFDTTAPCLLVTMVALYHTELRGQAQQKTYPTPSRPSCISSSEQCSGSFSGLEVEFACLKADLIDCLKDDQKSLSMMRNALRNWDEKPEFKGIEPGSLEKARTVEEFFVALKPHYLDCTLLYIAIRAQKNTVAKKKMEEYLALKEEADVLQDEKDEMLAAVQASSQCAIAEAVIQKEALSGKQYEETTSWLSYMWGIPRVALRFLWGKKGSIIVQWQIDASLESYVKTVGISGQALKALSKLSVTQVTLGNSYWLEIPQLTPMAKVSLHASLTPGKSMKSINNTSMYQAVQLC